MLSKLLTMLHMFPRNTKERGSLTFFTYRDEKEQLFTTVCLEMDLVKMSESEEESVKDAVLAAQHLLELVRRDELNEDVLNRAAPKEYWDLYKASQVKKPSILDRVRASLDGKFPEASTQRSHVIRISQKDLLTGGIRYATC